MITEYEVLFEKYGGHGKEAELRIFQEIVVDAMTISFEAAVAEARQSLIDLVDDPSEWKPTGVRRIK